jgi:hypothetical protein
MHNEISFKTVLTIAANSREELRPQDVDRVMEQADYCGVREEFRAWLLAAKKFTFGTREEIAAWQPEVAA